MTNITQNNMSMESLIAIFGHAPVALAMLMGEEQIVAYANPKIIELWGKRDVIGLPFIEAIPEMKNQHFPALLENVYKTGIVEVGKKVMALLEKDGVIGEYYFNYIYSPVYKGKEIIGVSIVATEVADEDLLLKELPNL